MIVQYLHHLFAQSGFKEYDKLLRNIKAKKVLLVFQSFMQTQLKKKCLEVTKLLRSILRMSWFKKKGAKRFYSSKSAMGSKDQPMISLSLVASFFKRGNCKIMNLDFHRR